MSYQLIDNIVVYGDPIDQGALSQIKTCALMAEKAVLCADHHKGYAVPIGGVVAHKDAVNISGVGFDIGCGNKACLFDIPGTEVRPRIKTIMDDIWQRLSFGIGRKNDTEVDHPLFESETWRIKDVHQLKSMAQSQLGTIGSGNHYVDLFTDELDRVWVGVHFGSRGLGHKIASRFLEKAGAKDGMDVPPTVISIKTGLGEDYYECMKLAGEYAYAGRDWVCDEVARILGANVIDSVHNHHNYCWEEVHDGEKLYVARKGATPAFPGQRGFVGGSMGDNAVIIEGLESDESRLSLYSTVHGAGRVMSRTAARGKINRKTGEVMTQGAISHRMMMDWVKEKRVELRGAGVDEAPHAYKRLPEVLAHHEGTIKILHTLRPIGVAMAGENEHDPYKD